MTTNAINNECTNDFTVTGGASGSLRKLRIENNYNVASTSSILEHYTAGTTADDPYTACIVGTTASYALGIDQTDSQSFKLGYNAGAAATPSSTTFLESDTDCHNFYPLQPCFRAYVTGTQTNVTGAGETVTVQFNSEEYDVGSNYSTSTYQFTAPVAGRYLFVANVYFEGIDSSKTGTHIFLNVNSNQLVKHVTLTYPFGASGTQAFPVYCITDMAASDTADVELVVYGTGTTIDIVQDGSHTDSFFAGYLLG